MRTYPYKIENGSGEELVFLGVALDQGGDRLEVEIRAQPGAGPPMHVHHLQEEAMTVVSGKLGFQTVGASTQRGVLPHRSLRFDEAGWPKTPGLFRRGIPAHPLEMRMLEIPAVVQTVAFPILLAAGRILGKYDRFQDAPEPVLESQVRTEVTNA